MDALKLIGIIITTFLYFFFQVNIDLLNGNGRKIYKIEENVCKFIENDKLIYPHVKKITNLVDKCPAPKVCKLFQGQFIELMIDFQGKYHVRECEFDEKSLPAFMSPDQYTIVVNMHVEGRGKAACKFDIDVNM